MLPHDSWGNTPVLYVRVIRPLSWGNTPVLYVRVIRPLSWGSTPVLYVRVIRPLSWGSTPVLYVRVTRHLISRRVGRSDYLLSLPPPSLPLPTSTPSPLLFSYLDSSVPPNPTQNSEDSPPRHFLPQLSDSSGASTNNDSDTSTRGKTWLQAPTDFLRNQVKKYTASPILNETDIESPRVSKVEGGESMIEKADRVFTVSSRDVSMLERISQRARDRAIQIQRPHEVRELREER